MAGIGKNIRNIWMKGMEAIGNTANNIATTTRYKVEETNLINRRTEILTDFGNKAYALWQKGEKFPEEMEKQLAELGSVDERLNSLRMEYLAGIKAKEAAKQVQQNPGTPGGDADTAAEKNAEEASDPETEGDEDADEDAPETGIPVINVPEAEESEEPEAPAEPSAWEPVPVIRTEEQEDAPAEEIPFRKEINDLFEDSSLPDDTKEQVSSALDALGDSLKAFSDRMQESVSELDEKIRGGRE